MEGEGWGNEGGGGDFVYPRNKTNSSDMTDTPHYYSHLFTSNQIKTPLPQHFPLPLVVPPSDYSFPLPS